LEYHANEAHLLFKPFSREELATVEKVDDDQDRMDDHAEASGPIYLLDSRFAKNSLGFRVSIENEVPPAIDAPD
jgi:hypothetical protein